METTQMSGTITILAILMLMLFIIGLMITVLITNNQKYSRKNTPNTARDDEEDILVKRRQEKQQACDEVFAIADAIQISTMRLAALEALASIGLRRGNNQFTVPITTIFKVVRQFSKPANSSRDAKSRLIRLINQAELGAKYSPINLLGDREFLTSLARQLDNLRKDFETWNEIKQDGFLLSIEQAIASKANRLVCVDCSTSHPQRCAKDHCLHCAKYRLTCFSCAQKLGDDCCVSCQTIKPFRAKNGRCGVCLKKHGHDACHHCGAINPDRCSTTNCNKCLECSSREGDLCYGCYDYYYGDDGDD